jgi:hypothetical protein
MERSAAGATASARALVALSFGAAALVCGCWQVAPGLTDLGPPLSAEDDAGSDAATDTGSDTAQDGCPPPIALECEEDLDAILLLHRDDLPGDFGLSTFLDIAVGEIAPIAIGVLTEREVLGGDIRPFLVVFDFAESIDGVPSSSTPGLYDLPGTVHALSVVPMPAGSSGYAFQLLLDREEGPFIAGTNANPFEIDPIAPMPQGALAPDAEPVGLGRLGQRICAFGDDIACYHPYDQTWEDELDLPDGVRIADLAWQTTPDGIAASAGSDGWLAVRGPGGWHEVDLGFDGDLLAAAVSEQDVAVGAEDGRVGLRIEGQLRVCPVAGEPIGALSWMNVGLEQAVLFGLTASGRLFRYDPDPDGDGGCFMSGPTSGHRLAQAPGPGSCLHLLALTDQAVFSVHRVCGE